MFFVRIAVLLHVINLFGLAVAFPSGAPESACVGMVPSGHGVQPQTDAPPYQITVSNNLLTEGGTIQVTISGIGGATLKGFLLQARRADPSLNQNVPIGTFSPVSGAQEVCLGTIGNALTHDSNSDRTQIGPITWTAPDTLPGHIEFRATVVQERETFWVGIKSEFIRDPTAPDITEVSVQTNVKVVNTRSCGLTKSCVSFPPNCFDNCEVIATWTKPDNNLIHFELEAETDGWVALGFSNTMFMTNTSATACIANDLSVSLEQMWIDAYSAPKTLTENTGLSAESGALVDGRVTCRFTREISVQNNEVFDFNQEAYIIIARGEATAGGIVKHHDLPCVSRSKMDLSKDTFMYTGIDSYKSAIVRTHGIMMTVAWMFCVSVAIIMARYFKTGILKEKWFQVHRFLQIMTITLTILAFVIIFIEARGYTLVSQDPRNPKYLQAHAPLGIITTILTITNVIMALFRPHPGDKGRNVFNWGHWIVGTSAHICGLVAIFIGLGMPKAKPLVTDWTIYVVLAFVAVQVVTVLCLEIGRCYNSKKQLSNIEKYERMSSSMNSLGDNNGIQNAENGQGSAENGTKVNYQNGKDQQDGKVTIRQKNPPQAVKLADMMHKYIILVIYIIFVFCLSLMVIITLATR